MNEIIYVRLCEIGIQDDEAIASFYYPVEDLIIQINLSVQAKNEGIETSPEEITEAINRYALKKSNMKLLRSERKYQLKKLAHILEQD